MKEQAGQVAGGVLDLDAGGTNRGQADQFVPFSVVLLTCSCVAGFLW
jgi:hypothetical protein